MAAILVSIGTLSGSLDCLLPGAQG